MNPVAYLNFEEVANAAGPITKFGGKPWGLKQADWPRDKKAGQPLEFIAQIVLEPRLFPGAVNQLAYVFWDPDSLGIDDGVVIVRKPSELTDGFANGPAIHRVVLGPRRFLFREKKSEPCEFNVSLKYNEEPSLADVLTMFNEDEPESEQVLKRHGLTLDELVKRIDVAKIGGTAHFIQSDETMMGTDRLLLQLPDSRFPFQMALGDAGTFFAFLNEDLTTGYGFWECY